MQKWGLDFFKECKVHGKSWNLAVVPRRSPSAPGVLHTMWPAFAEPMKTVWFEFDAGLLALLARAKRQVPVLYEFSGPQSAKHLIESLGIPHTEIGTLTRGEDAVALGYLVQDGDRLLVTSAGPIDSVDGGPRFILDGHLGRLSARLRMLGYDCLYRADFADDELARIAVDESRFLLSRDRRLLMRKAVSRGYLVRNLDTRRQLAEVASRFDLQRWMRPFTRCIRCNHLLQGATKQDVMDKLQPLTRLYYTAFRRCPACGQVYWSGSHVEHMRKVISDLALEKPM